LHTALFTAAGIDGAFTDFTDVTRAWLLAPNAGPAARLK